MATHVCPWWIGYVMANPLRRLIQRPEPFFEPYVSRGMTVIDLGCGMGYFSIPMAKAVGAEGRVICVDLQEKMLKSLEKRAERAGLRSRFELRKCGEDDLGLSDLRGSIDFALACYMVHETPDQRAFLSQVGAALKEGGQLLIAEPTGHVKKKDFDQTLEIVKEVGLTVVRQPDHSRSYAALLRKQKKS